MQSKPEPRPGSLHDLKVIEFSHMVMGPSCGLVLADMGADVVKVEPAPDGDKSRRLTRTGVGFFPTYNRNKRSLAVDLKAPAGLALVRNLLRSADVLIENFRPGAMDSTGLGWEAVSALNPRLVYCSCKGFLPGPYEHRAALDEVVQMMGGMAQMTGPPGRPLRAGASVNDLMGGLFGVVAILGALRQREETGLGQLVQSGLFETNAFFVAQHMAYAAIMGADPPSFADPAMGRPWPVYDVFETAEPGQPVFVGVVTDGQWRLFCAAFGLEDLREDPNLSTMGDLAAQRERVGRRVAEIFRTMGKAELIARLDVLGLPFAPVGRPSDLFEDPHLLRSGGLNETRLETATQGSPPKSPSRGSAGLPGLPITFGDGRPGLRRQPPHVGEHSAEIARETGLSESDVTALIERKVLRVSVA